MSPSGALVVGLFCVGAVGLAVLAARRPLYAAAAAALLVPLTAALQVGTPVPLARPDAVILLAVAAGVVLNQNRMRRTHPLSAWDLAVGGYSLAGVVIPLAVLALTQYQITATIWGAVLAPGFFLLAYYVFAQGVPTRDGLRLAINCVLAAGVVVCAIAVAELVDEDGIRQWVGANYPAVAVSVFRPGSTLGGYYAVAAFGCLTYIVAVALAAVRASGFPRLWLTLAMAVGLVGVIASQVWAALAVLPVITAIVVVYARRLPVELAPASLVGLVALIALWPLVGASYDGQHTITAQGLVVPEAISARARYWNDFFIPALSGHIWFGTGTVIPSWVPAIVAEIADNDYIRAAFRGGMIGVALLIAMLVSIAALGWGARRASEPLERALGAIMLATAAVTMILGATAQYLGSAGFAETVAMLIGIAAAATAPTYAGVADAPNPVRQARWRGLAIAGATAGSGPLTAPGGIPRPSLAVQRQDVEMPAPARPLAPAEVQHAAQALTAVPAPSPRARRLPARYRVIAILTLAMLAAVTVRASPFLTTSDDQLLVHVGSQAIAQVDLRQSVQISPYLIGANVFPASGTHSVDNVSGFMSYGSAVVDGLREGGVKLLRFPGGAWGEEHLLSYDQIDSYSTLLARTGAQGMINVRLAGTTNNTRGLANLTDRANLAGRWVDYTSNLHSDLRVGAHANSPYYPIKLWAVGNEPDLTVNVETGKRYKVAEYVDAFIKFSISMHQNNPTIRVFGPELSRFDGLGAGPEDADGRLWIEDFLRGVAEYEKSHSSLQYHLLDGVSFHFYPGLGPQQASTSLMTNSAQWTYLLDPLRQLIRQTFDRDLPLAVTEINAFATGYGTPQGLSALWWADTLGMLMNQQVEYLAFFAAEGVDVPYPLLTSTSLSQTPMLRVLQLYGHLQSNLIPLEAQRDPISVYATQSDSHRDVSLVFINKSGLTQLAQISGQDHFLGVGPWAKLDLSLAPYSATVVTLHRGGGADAYSLSAVSDDNATGGVIHTACGNKSDQLAYQVPC